MDTTELKKIYYGLLATNPDSPAWEEFEYLHNNTWYRVNAPIQHRDFDTQEIRHNPKPKQWQPIDGVFLINPLINRCYQHEKNPQERVNFGLCRTNQEQAEQDLKQIRQFCRFLAWRAENCCYSDGIVPALDYVGCFLNKPDYLKLKELIDSGEVEL